MGLNPVKTPLDANNRLSKRDCPEVVDPNVHRRYRSIVGCLSYLVNMTRPVHLEAAERVLQYLRATYDQGISYYDLGPDKRNKLPVIWIRFCQCYRFEKVYDWLFDVA